MNFYATTSLGLEPGLVKELWDLGAEEVEEQRGGVSFNCSIEKLYEICLSVRTAIRILKPLKTFSAASTDMLYDQVRRIPWEDILTLKTTFSIESSIAKKGEIVEGEITHSHFASLKIKDAIADRMRKEVGARPDVNKDQPDIPIRAYFSDRKCTLSLDACGRSLHLRGYRKEAMEAPLQETIAAALVGWTGWTPDRPFFDPLCGSGTIPIEAALLASNTAPGLITPHDFAFKRWRDFNSKSFEAVLVKLLAKVVPAPKVPLIFGQDRSRAAIEIAKKNAKRAGMEAWIQWTVGESIPLRPPVEKPGVVAMNPPYGERLQEENLTELYRELGNGLKHHFHDWTAGILTGNLDAAKSVGLKTKRRIPLKNGPIECRFLVYELYQGSRKSS